MSQEIEVQSRPNPIIKSIQMAVVGAAVGLAGLATVTFGLAVVATATIIELAPVWIPIYLIVRWLS